MVPLARILKGDSMVFGGGWRVRCKKLEVRVCDDVSSD